MLPVAELSQVKSGDFPEAARKAAASGLAMSQRTPAPLLATFAGTSSMSTEKPPPSALHLKTESRLWDTEFWPPASMRISTYWRFGLPAAPDITSSITARWNTA